METAHKQSFDKAPVMQCLIGLGLDVVVLAVARNNVSLGNTIFTLPMMVAGGSMVLTACLIVVLLQSGPSVVSSRLRSLAKIALFVPVGIIATSWVTLMSLLAYYAFGGV